MGPIKMRFRRHNPTQDTTLPPSAEPTPTPSSPHDAPKTLEEILANLPKSPLCEKTSPTKAYHSSSPTRPGHSSEHPTSPSSRIEPRSRKTGHATIHTEATDTQAAFESDAFAIHMPTTRLPIIDHPVSSTTPSAQVEAYQTYKEKAEQVRERNSSQGVRVPSKIVSYDYASPNIVGGSAPLTRELYAPMSSPTPVGSFPISPPLPQTAWTRPERIYRVALQDARMDKPSKLYTAHKPVRLGSNVSPTTTRYRHHNDSEAGASRSTPSPTARPAPIRVCLKPKIHVLENKAVQTESRDTIYTPPSSDSSTQTSRSTSSAKSMPNFTRQNSIEGDSLFGYKSKDITGTISGATSASSSDKEKEKSKTQEKTKPTSPKRTLTSRWPWLRSPGPRVSKPTTLPMAMSNTAAKRTADIDPVPFTRHRAPVAATRPLFPRKIARAATVPPPQAKFDTGFAQIKSLAFLLLKIALALYAVVALYFVLDAIREAFHTIGAPFRAVKALGGFLWLGGLWLAKVFMVMG